jgi:hypothetical protein
MILLWVLKLNFDFGGKVKIAQSIANENNSYVINKTEKFKRIPLCKEDFEGVEYTLSKDNYGWIKNKPLGNGKYKISYNNNNYYVTYLDELDLFKQVVIQE